MNSTLFRFTLLCFASLTLASCFDNKDTVLSSDAAFTSLKFSKTNDSPKLSQANFTLVDGKIITNIDSLPYLTKIDKVPVSFTCNTTSAQYTIYDGDKVVKMTGKDTIDFTKSVQLQNVAADGVGTETYTIKVNVHKVEPELYVWSKITNNLNTDEAKDQKTVVIDDTLYHFVNTGTDAYVLKSADGKLWKKHTLTGFPVNNDLNDIKYFNGKLYLSKDGDKLYTSTSASNYCSWSVNQIADYDFSSLLFSHNNMIWAVVQSKSDQLYRFANSTDGATWVIRGEIPAGFPVRDFAAIAFESRNNRPKVLVAGGYGSDGALSTHRWSSEDGAYWVDFRPAEAFTNRTLDTLDAGASMIHYDNKLFVIGKYTGSEALQFKVSKDEGLSWQLPDTMLTKQFKSYEGRAFQSFVVLRPRKYNKADFEPVIRASNRIFLIAGKTSKQTYTDVWTGKLNRKNFLLQ